MLKKILIAVFVFITIANMLQAQIPDGYYNSASGLSGAALKTALYNIIKGHTVVSYSGLYTAYQTTDKKPNGKVWDMYSDIPGGTPPYEYSFSSGDQCGTYNSEGDCYNREHSIPQSWFNSASPMYSDLFNVIPTDGYVNNRRSNYPYGVVGSATWTSQNGSKLGSCSYTGYTGTVFEPIDVYKGDFARAYFYMATRYENIISSWHGNSTYAEAVLQNNSYPVFESWFLNMLSEWNASDPVSQKEIDRNNAVYALQKNRNPYIDHPEYVAAVWGGTSVLPEPTNHVANFVAGTTTTNSIPLTWSNNDGTQPATAHLVLINTTGTFTAPVDGTPVADDNNLADNAGAVNVSHSAQAYTWTSLNAGTKYYFTIYPYTNSGTNINYKTDGTAPAANATTQTASAPEINIKQGTTNNPTASTYTFGSQVSGTSSSAVTFTIENTGTANLSLTGAPIVAISGANAGDFSVNQSATASSVAAGGSTTFSVTFAPASAGSKTAALSIANNDATDSENPYVINLSGTATSASASTASDIIATVPFTYPANIAYANYQSNNITGGSYDIEVAKFTLRDGGASADADNLETTLNALTFSLSNPSNIRRVALYVDGTETGTEQAGAASVTFSGLNITAADNSTKDISVRVSFNSAVTDNQQFAFTVTAATASGTGSGFAAANAGGVASSLAGDNNRIEVTATKLVFGVSPSNVKINTSMSPAVTVIAKDLNSNTDLDYTTDVVMASTATWSGTATSTTAAVAGTATFSNLKFSVTGTGFTMSATSDGLTPTGNSTAFDVTETQPEINIKQSATNYPSGSTYAFGDQASGTTGSTVTFTVENTGNDVLNLTGTPVVAISGTQAGEFTINQSATNASIASGGTTTFTIAFAPVSAGVKTATLSIANNDNTGGENPYLINLTGNSTALNSVASDIIANIAFAPPANIAYNLYQAADITGGAEDLEVAKFTLRDGGASADADNLPTVLTAISFSLSNPANIRKVALYAGGVEAGTEQNASGTITFDGLNFSAPDNGSKDFSIRVSFNKNVTDNQQFGFKVAAASAGGSGSGFAASDTGGASTSNVGDNNRIEVTAVQYIFSAQPPLTAVVDADFGLTVQAVDANGSLDADNTSGVTLEASNGELTSAAGNPHALSGGTFTWNDLQDDSPGLNVVISASGLLTQANSRPMTIFDAKPTLQASSVTFSNITSSSMTVSWTKGNGSKRILVAKADVAPESLPQMGITYNAGAAFGTGAILGTNEFVVFNDAGNSVNITLLQPGVTYVFKVFEYNGTPGIENYLTPGAQGSQATSVISGLSGSRTYAEGHFYFGNGRLHLDIPASEGSKAGIMIYNVAGQLILSQEEIVNPKTEIPMTVVPGIYLVKVISGTKLYTGKVMIP